LMKRDNHLVARIGDLGRFHRQVVEGPQPKPSSS
jgi:hypothetical protein